MNVASNPFLQYKAFFSTDTAGTSPELYNVTVEGHTVVEPAELSISSAWVDWNGENKTMEGSGLSWSKTLTSLTEGDYTFRVYANDTYDNSNVTEERMVTVRPYDITFNLTDSFTNEALSIIDLITCNNSWSVTSVTNPYTADGIFWFGSYICTFKKGGYYDTELSFVADNDKIVNVPMSSRRELTPEEHYWLEQIYDCLYSGTCDLLSNINATVTNIWDQFKQTDESIITETIVTKDVNATSNLTIDYSIDVPTKENYEFLPIRIFYWFLNENNQTCYNQAKESDSAENPYCDPLVASTIGQVNTELNFTVELRPILPAGTYNIVRRVDIDPPVNGQPMWINYGHEVIGKVTVLEDSNEMLVSLFKTGDSSLVDIGTSEDAEKELTQKETDLTPPKEESGLSKITGNIIEDISSSVDNKIIVGVLCLIVFVLGMQTTVLYKLSRKK